MKKNVFQGNAGEVSHDMIREGYEYAIPPGRRAPMHRMHVECILEIIRAGMKPIIAIGSINGPESPLYDPVRNPLTVEQQKEQFRRALPAIDYNAAMMIALEDTGDDKTWTENFARAVKDAGIEGKAVVYFRSKSADAAKEGEAIKPLSAYTSTFIDNGLAVWQSYNTNPADDNISASDIRRFDLEHLTPQQRNIIAAPDYLISIARQARDNNPDKAALDAHNVPLSVLDLSLERMRIEAGIRTADIVAAAERDGAVTVASLASAADDIVKATRGAGAAKVKKPLLVLGNSVSQETAEFLKNSGAFALAGASIGKFQSGEPFAELFYGEKKNFKANADKIKGAEVFVVQSTAEPVADHIQQLLLMIHTLKFYGAAKVTAIVPFAAMSREDRAFEESFWSVGADLMAKQLKAAGADGVVTFTMHSQAAGKFYKKQFHGNYVSLDATEVLARYLEAIFRGTGKLVVGAPDGADKPEDEGQRRAQEMEKRLSQTFNDVSRYYICKKHTGPSTTIIDEEKSVANVAGADCIMVDDLVDGGGTLVNGARFLKKKGATSVTCLVTHAILTNGDSTALEKLLTAKEGDNYVIDRLVITDSVPEAAEKLAAFAKQYPQLAKKIDCLSLGPAILAEVKREAAAPMPANMNAPAAAKPKRQPRKKRNGHAKG